jgi:hypothetical protein
VENGDNPLRCTNTLCEKVAIMDSKTLSYVAISLVAAFALVIGIGVFMREEPDSRVLEEVMDAEATTITVRDEETGEVIGYNKPSTAHLGGFKKIHKKVDAVAEKRTRQANDAVRTLDFNRADFSTVDE